MTTPILKVWLQAVGRYSKLFQALLQSKVSDSERIKKQERPRRLLVQRIQHAAHSDVRICLLASDKRDKQFLMSGASNRKKIDPKTKRTIDVQVCSIIEQTEHLISVSLIFEPIDFLF